MIDEKIIVSSIEWVAENIYVVVFYVFALLFLQWILVAIWIRIDAGRRYKDFWSIVLMTFIGMVPLIGLFLYLVLRNKYSLDEKYYIDLEKKALFSESLSVMECYNCKKINESENIFCRHCGTKLRKQCPKCGTYSPYYNSFCSQCGYFYVSEDQSDVKKNGDKKMEESITSIVNNNVKKVKNSSKLEGKKIYIKEPFKKMGQELKVIFEKFKQQLKSGIEEIKKIISSIGKKK